MAGAGGDKAAPGEERIGQQRNNGQWPHFLKLQQQGAWVLPWGEQPANITFCVEMQSLRLLGDRLWAPSREDSWRTREGGPWALAAAVASSHLTGPPHPRRHPGLRMAFICRCRHYGEINNLKQYLNYVTNYFRLSEGKWKGRFCV